jgi:hypothetical protein
MLERLNGGEVIGFTAVVGGLAIAIIAVIAGSWASVRQAEVRGRMAEYDAALKQDMLARGMSAAEIERVLAAGRTAEKDKNRCI